MNEEKNGTGLMARAKQAAGKVAAVGTGLAASGMAMASGGGGFDSATVISKIEENAGTAALILGAFILAIWGLRSMGLFKRG